MAEAIDLYYWPTPNGWKITIFLEEVELPYNLIPVDITAGDQFEPEFLRISPNYKMPAIVDPEGPDGAPYLRLRVEGYLDLPVREDRQISAGFPKGEV
jgi:GST-like protein